MPHINTVGVVECASAEQIFGKCPVPSGILVSVDQYVHTGPVCVMLGADTSRQMLFLHSGNTICEQRLKHSAASLYGVLPSCNFILLRCIIWNCSWLCVCVRGTETDLVFVCVFTFAWKASRELPVLCVAELVQRLNFGLLIPFYSTGIMCYSNPNPIWGVWRWHEDVVTARTRGGTENHSHNAPWGTDYCSNHCTENVHTQHLCQEGRRVTSSQQLRFCLTSLVAWKNVGDWHF